MKKLQIEGVTMGGACPECGHDMQVLDGTYEMIDGAVSMLNSEAVDVDEINELLEVLQQAREEDWSAEEIRAAVEALDFDFTPLVDWIPDWIGPVGTIILILIGLTQCTEQLYHNHGMREQRRSQHEERMEQDSLQHEELIEKLEEQVDQTAADSPAVTGEEIRKVVQDSIEKQGGGDDPTD